MQGIPSENVWFRQERQFERFISSNGSKGDESTRSTKDPGSLSRCVLHTYYAMGLLL